MTPRDSLAEVEQFRKKPVVIDAVQLTEELFWKCHDDPSYLVHGKFRFSGDYHPGNRTISRAWISIKTLEGTMYADMGDWIIKGVKGEFYPCKPDIFDATYERALPAQGEAVAWLRLIDYHHMAKVGDQSIGTFTLERDKEHVMAVYAAPPAAAPQGWMPISTPPTEMGSYLTYPDYRELYYQHRFDGGTDGRKAWRWYDEDWECYPTHWMPLPPWMLPSNGRTGTTDIAPSTASCLGTT